MKIEYTQPGPEVHCYTYTLPEAPTLYISYTDWKTEQPYMIHDSE